MRQVPLPAGRCRLSLSPRGRYRPRNRRFGSVSIRPYNVHRPRTSGCAAWCLPARPASLPPPPPFWQAALRRTLVLGTSVPSSGLPGNCRAGGSGASEAPPARAGFQLLSGRRRSFQGKSRSTIRLRMKLTIRSSSLSVGSSSSFVPWRFVSMSRLSTRSRSSGFSGLG